LTLSEVHSKLTALLSNSFASWDPNSKPHF
jgi:hypothetical protein